MVLAMQLSCSKNQLIRVIASLPLLGSAPLQLQMYTPRLTLEITLVANTNMSKSLYFKQGPMTVLDDTYPFKFIKFTYYRFNICLNRISEGIFRVLFYFD
jgi:energy-converting hydrogenase Eha subunit H